MLKIPLATLMVFALPGCPSGSSGPGPSGPSVTKNDRIVAEDTLPEHCKGSITFAKLCYDKSDALSSCEEAHQIIDSSITVDLDDATLRAAIYTICRGMCAERKTGKPWSDIYPDLREICVKGN